MSEQEKQENKPTPTPNRENGEKKATKQTKARKEAKPVDDRPIWEKYGLNLQQETFCQYYTSPSEYFGNGVQSYVQAYDIDISQQGSYMSAAASASRLLNDVKVCKRINDLLDGQGLNDMFVDKQLLFLLSQHGDNNVKIRAISEYNKMKERVTERHEHTFKTPITKIVINKPKENNGDSNTGNDAGSGETGEGNPVRSDAEADAGAGTA